jgi:hypothetical protein
LSIISLGCEAPQPTFDVARRANEEVLQLDFAKAPVTAAAHAMPTRQFTEGAFNGITPVHLLLEGFATLFLATLLQKLMVLAHDEAAMLLARWNALFP